ncbi:MAG: hypothetical protein JXN59_09405 [Anaerolineae bacterium]|nr:hypothetical protein [Anaerolineae bacterium]
MPFLLLTQGDTIGLDLLKKLVDNRYGSSPPGIDALRVTYTGWSAARIGPLPLRAQVHAIATYHFPFQMRWEFDVRVLRFLNSRYTTTFDGTTVYEEQRAKITETTDAAQVQSARARAWSEAVYFISPVIADHTVRVQSTDNHSFKVFAPGFPDLAAEVHLSDDNVMQAVEIDRLDPGDNSHKRQRIEPAGGLTRVDGLIVPAEMQRYWNNELFMSLKPVKIELNPDLTPETFTLKEENLLAVLDEDDEPALETEEA